MYARRDPWVNILRGTVACFAAATGGADSITVLPFDHALGLPGRLALRLARNTQLTLLEESSLGRVADPAGGACGNCQILSGPVDATGHCDSFSPPP